MIFFNCVLLHQKHLTEGITEGLLYNDFDTRQFKIAISGWRVWPCQFLDLLQSSPILFQSTLFLGKLKIFGKNNNLG